MVGGFFPAVRHRSFPSVIPLSPPPSFSPVSPRLCLKYLDLNRLHLPRFTQHSRFTSSISFYGLHQHGLSALSQNARSCSGSAPLLNPPPSDSPHHPLSSTLLLSPHLSFSQCPDLTLACREERLCRGCDGNPSPCRFMSVCVCVGGNNR